MSEVWRRTMEWLGLYDDPNYLANEDHDYDEEEDLLPSNVKKMKRTESRGYSRHLHSLPGKQVSSQVHLLEPTSFNDAQKIAEKFKSNVPVIVNLQSAEGGFSQRIIDFVCGLTYGLGGTIQQVATKVFLLTPGDVEVSAEQRRKLQEGGFFFNQF